MMRRVRSGAAVSTAIAVAALSSAFVSSMARGQTCGPAPLAGCKQPVVADKALLLLKSKGGDGDKLLWKWINGEATVAADFGDPSATTTYTLCVYDETGGTPGLKLTAVVPPGGAWAPIGKGFKYKDPAATNDGIKIVLLKFGASGKAKIAVKGHGANLATPALPLTQDQHVIVQLKNSIGVCWEARYSSPATKNEAAQFKDKSNGPLTNPTATPTNTANGGIATPTGTPTPTPTVGGGGMCGNGFLEAGETCTTCPADCTVLSCTGVMPIQTFRINFTAPLGSTATAVSSLVGYRSNRVSLPGSGSGPGTRVKNRPPGTAQLVNDLNYAVRVVIQANVGATVPNGRLYTIDFDTCSGTMPVTPADFGCQIESCGSSNGPIDGCTCVVTTAP